MYSYLDYGLCPSFAGQINSPCAAILAILAPPCVPAEAVDQVDSTIRALDPTTDHLTPGAEQVDPVSGEVDVASFCHEL